MRAAFSLLALVIVAALALSMLRKQASALKPPVAGASPASASLPRPEAVREQVQGSLDEAARRTAEAASAAAN